MDAASEGNSALLRLNPPDHTRIRSLVSRAFTPKRVEGLREKVAAMTDSILDGIAAEGDVDVLDTLGFPLPVRVIGELVGVPVEDRDRFRGLVRAAASSLEFGISADGVRAAIDAMEEMGEYFSSLLVARRSDPQDDLVSALLAVTDEHDGRLAEGEMVATLILIFAAGFETTTNLIGNGLLTLLRHPSELDRLRDDRSLVPAAVEEILRFESPVQLDGRRALTDATIGGHAGDERVDVATGDWVITMLGAANRDPAVFDEPGSFRVVSRDASVLSFAHGIHYCLGASLARMEGQVVLERLLDRFGVIEWLDDAPAWRNSIILRGLDHLHVRFAP
jgi:cytochrome P450